MDNIKANKCLIFLDCCHAQSMPTDKDLGETTTFLTDFVKAIDSPFSSKKALTDEVHKGRGRVILTSCEAHETSLDLGSNGLFTEVLLACLNGKANLKQDGWVRLEAGKIGCRFIM